MLEQRTRPERAYETMNQHVRVSDLALVAANEPSPDFRIAFAKVGTFACKFIIGDPNENAVCCGAPTDGRSWCDFHRRVVFEPKVARVR